MTGVYSVVVGLGLVVLLLGFLVVALLRSHAEILRRLDKLGVRLDDDGEGSDGLITVRSRPGSGVVADIVGLDPDAEPVVMSPTTGQYPVLLAFLSTNCSSCSVFWEALTAPVLSLGGRDYRVVVVTLGTSDESPTRAAALRRGSVDVIMSSDAWADYEVPGAPYFALVDPLTGTLIGDGTSSTVEALEGFLRDSSGDQEWDQQQRLPDRTDSDRETMIDDELRRAGIEPGDPRLYHEDQESDEDDVDN